MRAGGKKKHRTEFFDDVIKAEICCENLHTDAAAAG
jgi:hypothetical protein